jgi:hypothetical protein
MLSLLLHTHIPDTSAESLLQINLYFKPATEWHKKAKSSVRGISRISDMPSTEFIQLLFTKNIFFFFLITKPVLGLNILLKKMEHLQHLLQSGFKFHLQWIRSRSCSSTSSLNLAAHTDSRNADSEQPNNLQENL